MITPVEERLFVPEDNEVELLYTVVKTDGKPMDLTAVSEIEFYIKASRDTDDAAAVVLTKTDNDITVDNPATNGSGVVTIPGNAIATPGVRWYRLDVIFSGARRTVKFGNLVIQDV
jgi:hypothetical protein